MTHEQRTVWHAAAIVLILASLLWDRHGERIKGMCGCGAGVSPVPQGAPQFPARSN